MPVAAPLPGELAFAVKLTPQADAGPAPESSDSVKQPATAAAAAVAPLKETRRADDDAASMGSGSPHDAPHETQIPTLAAPLEKPADTPPVSIPASPHLATPPQTHPAEVAQLSETPEAKAAQPLKQLSLQLGQEPQQRVQVQLVERSGELQVAVRAANPDVAQGLRQGISDLVGQLQQSGFHTEAWRPGTSDVAAPAAAQKPQAQAGSQHDNSQPQSGAGQNRQQGNQNPSRRPQWVEELEMTSAGNPDQFAGGMHGFSR